jgi:fluoride exporter
VKTGLGYLVVFFGAGIGGSLRHAVNRAALPFGSSFPWATLTVNVTGSFLMGVLAGWLLFTDGGWPQLRQIASSGSGQYVRLFLTTGILGGFTTFSAFSLEAALFLERGKIGAAFVYAASSVILSVGGLLFGLTLMRA